MMARNSAQQGSFAQTVLPPALVLIFLGLLALLYFEGNAWFNPQPNAAPVVASSQTPAQSAPQTISATISLDDQDTLPTEEPAAGDIVPFSFTVDNGGTAMTDAQYKVSVKWSTGEQDVIDENVLSLAPYQSTTVQEALKFEVAKETAQITVQFEQGGPSLSFTLPQTAVQ